MINQIDITLNYIHSLPQTTFQWRMETIITQTTKRNTVFAHFYFPDYPKNLLPEFYPLWHQKTLETPLKKSTTPTGYLLPSIDWTKPLPQPDFLIVPLADALINKNAYTTLKKNLSEKTKLVLYNADSSLIKHIDLNQIPFDFLYTAQMEKRTHPKSIFYIQTAADYQHIKQHLPATIGGPFVDTFLAQKRFHACPFSTECTSAACTHIGTHPNAFLKCANPPLLLKDSQ